MMNWPLIRLKLAYNKDIHFSCYKVPRQPIRLTRWQELSPYQRREDDK